MRIPGLFLPTMVSAILLVPMQVMAAAPTDAGKGAVSWTQQMARAPHRSFTGKEYCSEKWNIIMPQMATYGQLSYHEARNIAAFLGSATEPCGDSWFAKNVLLGGYGAITHVRDDDEKESTTDALYAQHFFVNFTDRLQLQGELEFEKPLSPSGSGEFEGAEYLNLTYFAGDHVQLTAGKILNDFNYSNLRLHPVWMNLAIDAPWAAGFIPGTTQGGKIGVHHELNGAILGGTIFGGNENTSRRLAADEMVGGRFGVYLPERKLEFGVSAAEAEVNNNETVYGGYAIKKFPKLKLEGELAKDSDRMSYWIGATARPWTNNDSWWSRFSLVARFQEFDLDEAPGHAEEDVHADDEVHEEGDAHDEVGEVHVEGLRFAANEDHGAEEVGHIEEEAGHADEEAGHEDGEVGHADEEVGHADEGGHHAALPEGDAKEWYFGVNYDHPPMKNVHFRLQAGYFSGSGLAHDGWRARASFHW